MWVSTSSDTHHLIWVYTVKHCVAVILEDISGPWWSEYGSGLWVSAARVDDGLAFSFSLDLFWPGRVRRYFSGVLDVKLQWSMARGIISTSLGSALWVRCFDDGARFTCCMDLRLVDDDVFSGPLVQYQNRDEGICPYMYKLSIGRIWFDISVLYKLCG